VNSPLTINAFTWVFLAALVLATGTRLWLAARQVRHVRAHRDAVPESFAGAISLASHQKAADYTVAKVKLGMLDSLLDVLVLLALTLGGVLQWLIGSWERWFPADSLWHGVALILTVVLVRGTLELPVSLYRTFVIEERFGFNKMTWRLFAVDLLKTFAIAAVLGIPLLLAVLWLMAAAGSWWWLYVWLVLVGFSVFLQLVAPALILPMFNKFSPLEDPALVERVQRLLARCGCQSRGLYVMDGSKRSSHGNAFFTGFGATKRIVLFDTLIARLQPAEVEAVLAHELGHFRLRHVIKGMLIGWASTFLMLFVLGMLVEQDWFYAGLGVTTQTLAVALLLFMLVLPEFTFFLHPLRSIFSRKHEFEADGYAAKFASSGDLIQALVKLYKDNAATLTPDPLHSAFYDSHPPAATRIARLKTA
jgi:STE24 endopeptidase